MPRADLKRINQIEPGKWYRINSPETNICCDCSLVHVTEYSLHNGMLMFRTTVDRRATNKLRRQHGITVSKPSESTA